MEAAIAARKLAVALARFVIENGDKPLEGEKLSAIIYRLRVVDSYASTDIDLICDAIRILILQLVNLPPVTFAPEVWVPIFTAVSEGVIEPLWSSMMESVDISALAEPYEPEPAANLSSKCCEQITSICQEYVLELGLTRRLFSAFWGADLALIARQMEAQKWSSVKIETSTDSVMQIKAFLEKQILDSFAKIGDHEQFAKELFYTELAQIMKRFEAPDLSTKDDDSTFYDTAFETLEEIVKKAWPYLYKDAEVKKNALTIFEQLISLASSEMVQKTAEKMKDTCEWLKISAEEICAQIEDCLWNVTDLLVLRLFELKKSIPYEIEYDFPDDFEEVGEKLPSSSSNEKERYLRFMVESTRATLHGIVTILINARKSKQVVRFMSDTFPELSSTRETQICDAAVKMYKESNARHAIDAKDQLLVAEKIMSTKAIITIPLIIQCTLDKDVSNKIVHRLLLQMADYLEEGNEKKVGFVKYLHDTEEVNFWREIATYADKSTLGEMAKKIVLTASGPLNALNASLATDIFLTILKLKLESDGGNSVCNFDYASLGMSEETWNNVGNKIVQVNMLLRADSEKAVPLFTLRQLTSIDELSMRELIYAVTQLKYLRSEEGVKTHREFYARVDDFEQILNRYLSKENLIRLCAKFLEEFSKIVVTNEKCLIYSLDHENLIDWLKYIDVLDAPIITARLVEMSRSIEAWDCLMLLQLDTADCSSEDLLTFSRFWKSDVMTKLSDGDQKWIEDEMCEILKSKYEKQTAISKATRERRTTGQFPARPRQDQWEKQLVQMHNRIAEHLTKMHVESFSDESSELFSWLAGVCAGQVSYSSEIKIEAKKIMARLYTEAEKRNEVQYHYGVRNVLFGINNERCGECLTMRDLFSNIYCRIVKNDMETWREEDSMETVDRRMGGLRKWLQDECGGEITCGLHLSIVTQISNVLWEKKNLLDYKLNFTDEEIDDKMRPIRKFVEVVASVCSALPRWMLPSAQPYLFAANLRPLFDLIYSLPDVADRYREPVEACLYEMFIHLFSPQHQLALLQHPSFGVQLTDKYLSTTLTTDKDHKSGETKPVGPYEVKEIMTILGKYGSERLQLKCLAEFCEKLKALPDLVLKNVEILSGREVITTEEQKIVVCHVKVLTEVLGYVNCLQEHVSPRTSPDDDLMKAFILLENETHQMKYEKNKENFKPRDQNENLDMNYCSFKTTGKNFVKQHWYNCYTCEMIDSIGVCSVCAVNCHRGHELTYSKFGAFFCDCGSSKCESMDRVEHVPNSMNSLRGQYPNLDAPKNSPKPREIFTYQFENLDPATEHVDLKKSLANIWQELRNKKQEILKILEAIGEGNKMALQVTDKRRAVLDLMTNLDKVQVSHDEKFMDPLESGHFLPIRRIDSMLQDRNNPTPKIRELADTIKLDNGTELLAMIPECVQTCLQLHYMDTRSNLLQGMFSMRTETESIPFNARRLHISGNRLVACGLYEIYALRFSPQGAVIDRAHIKLSENEMSSSMQSNPVIKAQFCRESNTHRKNQFVAVATLQYVRVYDLTLHESNFIEEMVLTAGNVEDVVLLSDPSGALRVIVLSTTGYLYEHVITDCTADNNSIFLTNVVNIPDGSGFGVSLYYTHTFNLLFCSFQSNTYVASLPPLRLENEREGNETVPRYDWYSLNLKSPVHVWREVSGIIACLSSTNPANIVYIHPTAEKILVQLTSVNRPIITFFLSASSKNQGIYSVLIYPDMPTCEIWATNWHNVHDLWIDDVPSERLAIAVVDQKTLPPPLPQDDLVLMAEQCEPLLSVDWSSRDLEMFYTHTELNHRLSSASLMPITLVQLTHFTLSARIMNSRQVVRMIRVEVEGANGPEAIKVGNVRYTIGTRAAKVFELRLTREESISVDHRAVSIEVIPRQNQTLIKIKSIKLFGCDRTAMDEVQPLFEREPILTLPNRLICVVMEFAIRYNTRQALQSDTDALKWVESMAKRHLNRKLTHPLVYKISVKALVMCFPKGDSRFFDILDEAYLQEWKELEEWTEEKGFGEMRTLYVEQLLEHLESVRTRWPLFQKSLIRKFGTATSFVQLMKTEMLRMPLHRCQLMAQAIVKIVFGLLANGLQKEERELSTAFLNIFTDEQTAHLANDMRSAVQETVSRFENAVKEEKKIIAMEQENTQRVSNANFGAFYGAPRVLPPSPESSLIIKLSGSIPLETTEDNAWLERFISRILEKLRTDKTLNSTTSAGMQISDSPSYNLSRVLASCLALCDPQTIGTNFSILQKSVNFKDETLIYPLSNETFSNYALLRSVELLLFVFLEKRTNEKEQEKKPYTAMLDGIVSELESVGIRDFCYRLLEKLIQHWKEHGPSTFSRNLVENRRVWLPHVPLISSSANPPNAIMNWPSSIDDAYVIACTDLVLLIPQHLLELERRRSQSRDDHWIQKLCQLASLSQGCSAYRQCKKLLLAFCHNDEAKYKIMRDKYKMQDLLQQLVHKYLIVSREVGGHQQLTELVDVLVSITKLALVRPDMWRDVCSTYTTWLLRLACYTTDVVASQVVELLIVAVRESSVGSQLSIQLADSIIESNNGIFIEKIIDRFLIGKDETLRWTMHGMLRSVIQLASRQNQCQIVKKLYQEVYPRAKNRGIQAAQLVDLIATYAPRVFSSQELVAMTQSEIARVGDLSSKLDTGGYLGMHRQMAALGLGWKSIQFDRNPCLVCFTTKGSHDTVKMQSIRSDTRYSPHTMIYKLISNYEVSKVIIKMTDIKRTKMIKKASLYYCAKSAEPVELKLHPEMWRKCAVVNVAEGENTINLSLAVPIVTSSLIIEFDEVADMPGSTQLHCPRCSGTVRSHAGVCESCGENAFQCIKCRAINYVEKEPFLCQSCGFCKYARIELFAVCRALPGAQHITCDAERGQCVQEMTQLLTKIETTKTKLTGYRAVCESLYVKSRPLPTYKLHCENSHVFEFFEINGTMSKGQYAFQSVTHPMNNLAAAIRTLHAELCQQTLQLIYLHEELNRYDHASEVSVVFHKPQNAEYYSTSKTCFGCISNQLLHSIALLHSSCEDENALKTLLNAENLIGKLGVLAQDYETLREEIEELLVRFMYGRVEVTGQIESLCQSGDVNISVIVKSLSYAADPTWQQKLKVLMRIVTDRGDENDCLQALMVLNKFLEATAAVPVDEKKKIVITDNSRIAQWLTTSDEWSDCCASTPSTSSCNKSKSSNFCQWITDCLFSQWMTVRSAANKLLINLSHQQFHEPIAILLLCENLLKFSTVSSAVCDQFMSSAHQIIGSSTNTKTRLFIQKFHVYLIRRIHEECAALHAQDVSLSSDVTFGERLRCFVELLALLLSGSSVENVLLKAGADDLLIFLLHSTIFLKRLMSRRTRAIDSSRMSLEKLLRRVSCRDGSKLMNVCVESLKLVKDSSTLGIIVGVMLEIMHPQQEADESFLIQIEKDVAQEDFLQGRMTHNPYSSADPGMGPLMRDIKNKICRDTEMIALMEDDNGMELLVNGNIISLSLPVSDVYERLWKRSNIGAPMLIVYRMRGLMGDAIETFIESFGVPEDVVDADEEDEQLVRMVNTLAKYGGLDKIIDLMDSSIETSAGRFLLGHLRKIFDRIVKTSVGRRALVERRIVERMMSVIRKCCADATNESKVQIGMELYKVVEFIVCDKKIHSSLCGIRESDAIWWFDLFEKRAAEEGSATVIHRKEAQILDQMSTAFGNVVLGSDASEQVLVSIYPKVLKWHVVDTDPAEYHTSRTSHGVHTVSVKDQTILKLEQLAQISSNLVLSESGIRLKQKILESGVITDTCQYLMKDLPNLFQPTESSEWKAFLGRPSLKLILTILYGLAHGHTATQKEIAKTTLKLMHRLEQVASDNSIGTLAENVIDALNEDPEVKLQITQVREETKRKKKQMAMANRNKQLNKLGMKIGSGGEVKVAARVLHNEPVVEDTDTLVCCICRESVLRGDRAAGVYSFGELDQDAGKVSTVSMMVTVHIECHRNAIRGGGVARPTDEWTKAKLHNAGAKCNAITPLAMGEANEASWNDVSNRFETDLGRIIGQTRGTVNRNTLFFDICRLVDRFIYKRSFSLHSEGGGRESNMQYLGILHLYAVSLPAAADIELESNTPGDRLTAFLFTELTAASWNDQRDDVLRAALNDAVLNGAASTWQALKPTLLTWAFVNAYFNKVIPITDDRLEWLRSHVADTIQKTRLFVDDFDQNVLPCEDPAEFCDVTGASLADVNMFLNPPPQQQA